MANIRVALIGCGDMGSMLAAQLPTLRGVELVTAYDPVADRRKAIAQKYGAVARPSIEKALADADCAIAAPTNQNHTKVARRILESGKHLFIEKPFTLSVEDCDAVTALAKRRGLKLMIAHVLRYFWPYPRLKTMIEKGTFGRVTGIHIRRAMFGWGGAEKPWRLARRMCGGLLPEVHVHELDVIRHLIGDVASVHAMANKSGAGGWDYNDSFVVNLRFKSGVIGSLYASLCDGTSGYAGSIVGDRASASYTVWPGEIRLQREDKKERIIKEPKRYEDPYRREVREFFEALRDDRPVTIPPEDGRAGVALIEAIERSVKSKREEEVR